MLKNSLAYFVLWIILQLLVKVNCQIMRNRRLHTATFIDNKLYILGGSDAYNEFIYLDFSVKFNTKNLLWHNLTSINTVPSHLSAASVKGGANNNTLFLFGGNNVTNAMALVYTFDPQSSTWSTPTIASGINITRKESLLGIVDSNGKMYLWGGFDSINRNTLNGMLILDTINLSWGNGSLVGAPTGRYYYGATLLPNRSIIYMGGLNGGVSVDFSIDKIYIYDTINNNWYTKATSGKIPSNGDGFSVILGLDGQRVILFGGTTTATPGNSLYALNLINFEWYTPKISGQIPSPRYDHKANVIGKFMVISFGAGYDQSNESDILLLDIGNNEEYIWTNDFIPLLSSSPQATSPNNPQQSDTLSLSKASVAGAIIGALFGGILISFGCFFLYKWNKNKQKRKNTLPIPGDENREGNYNPKQEKNLISINDSYNHGQEISQIPRNESTTNHESIIIPAPVINENYRAPPYDVVDLVF